MTLRGSWMQTYTGGAYWPLDPRPQDVRIDDIAHALSMICRYGGHCSQFYSVAEHSWHVSNMVPAEFALAGLLHDAAEAYLGDVIRPIKGSLQNYREIEALNWEVIAKRFDLPVVLADEVHKVDNDMCVIESRALMHPSPIPDDDWRVNAVVPDHVWLNYWSPADAKAAFLRRFKKLWV